MSEAPTTSPAALDEPAPAPEPEDGGRRTRTAAGWVVAVVAVAVAVVASVQWLRLDGRAATEEDVGVVAGRAMTVLTTWQASELDDVRAQVTELGTDRFQEEASLYFDQFSQGLSAAGAESRGELVDLAVSLEPRSAAEGPSAVALAVLRQEIRNRSLEVPDVSCWGARALLVERGGGWRVDRLELYGPNECPR